MKKFFYSLTVLVAVAAAVSCTIIDGHDGVVPVSEGEIVTLSVGISTPQTKATGNMSDDAVKSLQVFVFADGGGLERTAYVEGVTEVEMNCYTGAKEVVAIVNAPSEISLSSDATLKSLSDEVTKLEENSLDRFFMYGSDRLTLTANGSATIEVTRRVARFVLKTVNNEITSNSSVGELYLNNVYLINVAGTALYDGTTSHSPSKWYNNAKLDTSHSGVPYTFLYDEIGKVQVSGNSPYSTQHYFYCYPNLTAGRSSDDWPTRLVVEATLNGTMWYYPVTVAEVKSNVSYEIDLTITGIGTDDPNSDVEVGEYEFIVSVKDWDTEGIEKTI
ncbi:MAG: fimbrial protein [Bacteroidales bacterium]|nr:fimbrial protein [Bacteroidales bacterium]